MTTSKQQIMASHNITDQNSLVQKLLPTGPRVIKRIIPAGKNIFTQIDKADMEGAVYNWLRGCGGFTEVVISFAKDPNKWAPNLVKAHSFDTRDPRPEWERTSKGRRDLAKKIAVFINDPARRIVQIVVKKEGIFLGEDKTGAFKPRITLTIDDLINYPGKVEGDKVASADWEPYIEFTVANKSPYISYKQTDLVGVTH